MEANVCKNYQNCPVFNGILHDKQFTAKSYRMQFCEAGQTGWEKCRRYQVKELTGKCPPDLLPNCIKTAEEVIKTMVM